MIVETPHPIIAASMNHVSDSKLAIACYHAGILPCMTILTFIHKETGYIDWEAFEKDLLNYNKETGSSTLSISLGSRSIQHPFAYQKIKTILNKVQFSHIEVVITGGLEQPKDFTDNDKKLFDDMYEKLRKDFADKKLYYKTTDIYSAMQLEKIYGKSFFDSYLIKGPDAAGTVTTMANSDLKENLKTFLNAYPGVSLIACGGISNYQHIREYLELGAEAVAIGTLFAASKESRLSDIAKKRFVEHDFRDVKKINDGVQNGIQFTKIGKDDRNNTKSLELGIETGTKGHLFAGGGIVDIKEILSVQEIVDNLTSKSEYNLESFCPEAWNQIEIDGQGDFKLCCLANFDKDFGMAQDKDGNTMNIMTHSIEEAMNSETHKKQRLELSKNIKPLRCRNCYDSEESTKGLPGFFNTENKRGVSKRQRVLWHTTPQVPEYTRFYEAHKITNSDGTIDLDKTKIVNLDLRFGNLCNQKCIMCSPQHSNQWYDDWISLGYGDGSYKKGHAKTFEFFKDAHGKTQMKDTPRWWETDKWWSTFDKMAPGLRHIYFTGGEPLVVPAMQKTLDILISKGYAKNIELRYDTNLSVINKKVIDKWKHFKNVLLCVSIDDVGDRYELIRHPGDFSKVKNNIITLQDNGIDIHYISTCVGTASPYSVIRVCELGKRLNVECNFRFLEGPKWLDMRYLPKSAKLEIIDTLEKNFGYELYDKWATAEIRLLKKYLDHSEEKYLHTFIRNMDILDKQRGTNWRQVLPDVVHLFKTHMPHIYKEKE